MADKHKSTPPRIYHPLLFLFISIAFIIGLLAHADNAGDLINYLSYIGIGVGLGIWFAQILYRNGSA